MQKIFVDQNVNILTGTDAERMLQTKNDALYYREGKGIIQVSKARWKEAQTCERTHWMVKGLESSNDRNDAHYQGFDAYRAIHGNIFLHAIELGCGPFTNLRIIGCECRLQSCTLLDPLIREYMLHPHCTYRNNLLRTQFPPPSAGKLRRALARRVPLLTAWMRSPLNPRNIHVDHLLACPIETMPTNRTFDLVVICNVIEHCICVEEVFSRILSITHAGSILIFQDKLYEDDAIKHELTRTYDAAHPLRVSRHIIESFCKDNFESLYNKILPRAEDKYSSAREDIYFIGRRIAI